MNTHTQYFNVETVEQEGAFPTVKICAEVLLLKMRKVKSIDLEAIQQAIERVLDGEAVNYAGKSKVEPPVVEIGSGRA